MNLDRQAKGTYAYSFNPHPPFLTDESVLKPAIDDINAFQSTSAISDG